MQERNLSYLAPLRNSTRGGGSGRGGRCRRVTGNARRSWRGRGGAGPSGGARGRVTAAVAAAAGRPVVEDTSCLLGIAAAADDVGVGEAGAPHHDATEARLALDTPDDCGKLVRRGE